MVEGDTAFLGIVLKNRLLTSHDYHRWKSGFTASVGLGVGNATGKVSSHWMHIYMYIILH